MYSVLRNILISLVMNLTAFTIGYWVGKQDR